MKELLAIARVYLDLFEREFTALILTLPRIYIFFVVSQVMGMQAVSRLVRNTVVIVLAAFAAPINLGALGSFDGTVVSYAFHFLKEALIGILLGYLVGWIYWAVQSAGTFIDNQRGSALAGSVDPLHGHETTPFGILFSQAFLTYTFITGAVLHIVMLLFLSFVLWPAGSPIPEPAAAFPPLMLAIADNGMRLIVIIGMPVVAPMFLAEFAIALVSRFAPQVQVFILAMPIKSALAVLVLLFYFSRLLPYATGALMEMDGTFAGLFELLGISGSAGVPGGVPR